MYVVHWKGTCYHEGKRNESETQDAEDVERATLVYLFIKTYHTGTSYDRAKHSRHILTHPFNVGIYVTAYYVIQD